MNKSSLLSFKAGMKYAAKEVSTHWNDTYTQVNQCNQSRISSLSILTKAEALNALPN